MNVVTSALSEIRGGTSEPSILQVTPGRLDRDNDQSSSIISGFVGLLTILLVIAVLCILWNWNKQKKRRGPYEQVTNMFLLTLLPSRQVRNIYDPLPRRQEELGRRQSENIHTFSIERLLSRNSGRPGIEHTPSQAGRVLPGHRAQTPAMRISDSAAGPWLCGTLTPSARHIHVRAAGDCLSASSERSRDYVNVPTAEEIAEALASTNNPSGNLFILPVAPELEFTEERNKGCGNVSDCTGFWSLETESNDPLSNEEGSSQTSNDFVNMAELDLEAIQGKQPWMSFRCCKDYENFSPADNWRCQWQEEEVTISNTDHIEVRTNSLGTDRQLAMQSGRPLDSGDCVIYQPSAQSETRQMKREEETWDEDSDDSNIVLATKLGGRDSGQEPDSHTAPSR